MNDFFNLLGDFFQDRPLTNEEQLLLLILGILVLAIGVIIGWIIQGLTTRRYKKELLLLRKDRDEFEVRYRATETKQKALAKELEAVSREKVDALDRIQGLQAELKAQGTEVSQLRQNNEALSTSNQAHSETINSLNEEITGLKTQNEELLELANTVVPTTPNEGANAGTESGQKSNEALNTYITSSEARFRELEAQLRAMNTENSEMRAREAVVPTNPYTGHQPVMDQRFEGSNEPFIIRADTTESGARTGNQGATEVIVQTTSSIHVPTIASQEAPEADDLTLIDNIGPFLQGKLNEADIYSYQQIANWTEADIVTYTNLIGYIPGIIQRDDWVGQARGLAMSEAANRPGDEGEFAFANSTAPTPTPMDEASAEAEDDLKIVEGIGPKIEAILKASGIRTFSVLADTSTERLREIMAEAGPRFKSHDPKTWAVQAGLAADGKLAELKAWQGELKGGK